MNKQNAKWRTIYGVVDKRGKDMEILLRLCAIKYYVRYAEVKKSFLVIKHGDALLDSFSELAINFDEKKCLEYKKSLERFFERFELGKKCKKVTILESLFVVTEKAGLELKITDEVCQKLENTSEFKAAARQGTMSVSNMRKRWKIAYEQLSNYD